MSSLITLTIPVKPKYIKEIGRMIREQYPTAVSRDFEHNKELVETVTNIESTTVRNRIAGYISRLEERAEHREEDF